MLAPIICVVCSVEEIPGTTKFVNTSMHGVGHNFVNKAFEEFDLPCFMPVAAQQAPDPEFPTVKFPNPEEKGHVIPLLRMTS